MFTIIALMLLGAGPTEPTPPKPPDQPVVKAPDNGKPEDKQKVEEAKQPIDAGVVVAKQEDASGEKKVEPQPEHPPIPPALTKRALCGEFTKTGKELQAARKKLDDDRKALEADRLGLEKLKIEIADARIALRVETERLEKLLAKRAESATEEPRPAAQPAPEKPKPPQVRPQEFDALAKTMKSMKPEAAAALIARTELPLAAAVLKRMKPADAGAVMDKLKPDLAAELISVMATISSAPAKGGRL